MKKLFVLSFVILIINAGKGQTLKYVIFASGANLTSLSFITNQQIIIKISDDGKVLEWGNELERGRYYSQPGRLQPYMGRIEYYERQFDSLLNGKIKSIGVTSFTYYGSQENPAVVGKVKSMGNIFFEYYNDFENESFRGKLKRAGDKIFSYYSSIENEAYRGKIRSVGNNQITYYSTFDDRSITGKLKTIGPFAYTWYTSFDRPEYRGGLKTGSQYQLLEGVTYVAW